MRIIRSLVLSTMLAATMLVLHAANVSAQGSTQLNAGDRVRVTTGARVITARTLTIDAAALTISSGPADTTAVPWTAIRRLDVSAGRDSRAGRAVIGGVVGLVAGGAVGLVLGNGRKSGGTWGGEDEGELTSSVFGFLGAAVGGLIGAAVTPPEKWRQVMLPTF